MKGEGGGGEMKLAVHEGWMVRYGRRKIVRSFIHMRYFVLNRSGLHYYKRKPNEKMAPVKTLPIDGNCRVEDRGLKIHHGHMVYVLSIYNMKERHQRMMMAGFSIQEALTWKEKIEFVIDQQQDPLAGKTSKSSLGSATQNIKVASSSENESPGATEDDDNQPTLLRRMTIGNGPPASVYDWTGELSMGLSNQNEDSKTIPKQWRLVRCHNGLRIFKELHEVDNLPRSCNKAMKAVGVVDATCEAIFELVMSMDGTRFDSIVSQTAARLVSRFLWPRDLCYVRYWRRNDDGSYVVLFQSREHANCGPQPGFVRAHIESGGFKISPLKSRDGKPRTQVQYLMQIDMKGWLVCYLPSFQQHCVLQMLNSLAGLRELFSQVDEIHTVPRIPVMATRVPDAVSSNSKEIQQTPIDLHCASVNSVMLDEESDEDEDFQIPETIEEETMKSEGENMQQDLEPSDQYDFSCFSGNLSWNDDDKGCNCWTTSDGNNFKVRSKTFAIDNSKTPAGKHLMDLVAVDWLKDTKRIDHVARRQGCAVQVASEKGFFSLAINLQVPGSTHYSMVFYFVIKKLEPGSLLERFVDGDDEFRNSRLKLIPSVRKGSWIVRQSVGSTPCLLGKAVDCTYIRAAKYLEIDVDIGSSTVANGVLGLVIGVITSLVVDMAFLVQANTSDELPERLIGAVRVSNLQLSSAIVPVFETLPSSTEEEKS